MPTNTSFLTVFILSFWGIRQAYCPYAFRFSEIYEKNSMNFLRLKSERERGRKKERERKREEEREKRERESRKIGEIGEIRTIREEKRADALRPLSLFSYPTSFLVPVPVPILIYISL